MFESGAIDREVESRERVAQAKEKECLEVGGSRQGHAIEVKYDESR